MSVLAQFEHASLRAAYLGSQVISSFQIGERTLADVAVKTADATLVTIADRESGEAIKASLQSELGNQVAYQIEDVGESVTGSPELLLIDPLDGTRPFATGAITSTIVVALYDTRRQEVVACRINEPATGRTWYAECGDVSGINYMGGSAKGRRHVWSGELGLQATLYLDPLHGFTRKSPTGKRTVLTDDQLKHLYGTMWDHAHLSLLGSNAAMQTLVANGGTGAAGGITTAIGGPWDICGGLLVKAAGGALAAFEVTEKGTLLRVKNPLNVLLPDILVYGNNQATVDRLSRLVEDLF